MSRWRVRSGLSHGGKDHVISSSSAFQYLPRDGSTATGTGGRGRRCRTGLRDVACLTSRRPGPDDDQDSNAPPIDGGGQRALRHTYLRVLCPLLKNTQLARDDSHYKRDELRKLFYLLVNSSSMHFAPVDETVSRLVLRCRQVDWIRDSTDTFEHEYDQGHATSLPTDAHVAKRILGMNIAEAGESSLSVLEVTAKVEKEKPMVPAPRRRKKQLQQPPETGLLNPSPTTAQSGERSPFDDEYNEE